MRASRIDSKLRLYSDERKYLETSYNALVSHCEALRDITSSLSDEQFVKSSPDFDRMTDVIAEMEVLRNNLAQSMQNANVLYQYLDHAISTLDDPRHRMILTERHLEMKPWDDIGDSMGLSVRHVKRLYAEAVEILEKKYNN